VDDDLAVQLPLQLRDIINEIALKYRRFAPLGMLEGRGDDVLGQAVELVGELATPGWPARCELLVGDAAQKQRLRAKVSSSLYRSPSSPRLIWNTQPPCLKSPMPPGSSTTPSIETNSVITIFAISSSPSRLRSLVQASSPTRSRLRLQPLAARTRRSHAALGRGRAGRRWPGGRCGRRGPHRR
jgi:hypothetical protein